MQAQFIADGRGGFYHAIYGSGFVVQ
jgi:hypothetical protein